MSNDLVVPVGFMPGSDVDFLDDPDFNLTPVDPVQFAAPDLGGFEFNAIVDDNIDLNYFDGGTGVELSYDLFHLPTGPDDIAFTVADTPMEAESVVNATGTTIDQFYVDAGLANNVPFSSRVRFTEDFDADGEGSTQAFYNSDTGEIAVSLDDVDIGNPGALGDTLLHEGVHAIATDSGFTAQLETHIPTDNLITVEEGLTEYAVTLVDTDRQITDPAYQNEVQFVRTQVIPNINVQGQTPNQVITSALGGDLGSQQVVVNAARGALGLGPVQLDEIAPGTNGVRERLASNSSIPILPFESLDPELGLDTGFFVGNQLDGIGLEALEGDDERTQLGFILGLPDATTPGHSTNERTVGWLLDDEIAGRVSDPNAVATWVSAGLGDVLFSSPEFRAEIVNHPSSLAAAIAVDPAAFESSGAAEDPAIVAVLQNDQLTGYRSDLATNGFAVDTNSPGATISNGQVVSGATAARFGDDLDATTARFNELRQTNDIRYSIGDQQNGLDLGAEDFEHFVTIGIAENGRLATDIDTDLFNPM